MTDVVKELGDVTDVQDVTQDIDEPIVMLSSTFITDEFIRYSYSDGHGNSATVTSSSKEEAKRAVQSFFDSLKT